MTMQRDIQTFADFWPVYLREHSCPRCRFAHYVAGTAAIGMLVATIWTGILWFLVLAPVVAYACAWSGHFIFEKNRPATWVYPLWSLRAEWRMFRLGLTRRLASHLRDCEEPGDPVNRS